MAVTSPAPDVEAFRLLRAGRAAEALAYAEQAVGGRRVCVPAHGLLATVLLALGRADDAEAVVGNALECVAGSADAYDALAHVSMQLGKHERANDLYRRAVERDPTAARFRYNLASSERSFGRLAEAETACDEAIALDPNHHPSYLLRSELRVQTDAANHVDQLQRRLADPAADHRVRIFLGYALGKELDDLGRFDEAFRWFHDSASLRRQHLAYDVAADERKLRRIKETESGVWSVEPSARDDSARHIFIVGLPRSGTTLLERILSGLHGVRSNGETTNFSSALLGATPTGPDDVFARAARADATTVAAAYERLAGGGIGDGRILEKMPMNYLYLGAIHRALPRAALLAVARSPLDSCFAMYRTLFGEAYPFSYDFEDLARYYAAYRELMLHWGKVLGERLRVVTYEDLVAEPRSTGAALAAHCGLPWDDSAIDVHKNTAVSLTASAAQVRRPIYGSSSGRWRHYRRHLEPLVRALRQRGVPLPGDA